MTHKHKWRWHSGYSEDGIDCSICAKEGYDPKNWMSREEVIRRINATEAFSVEDAMGCADVYRRADGYYGYYRITADKLETYARILEGDDE